MKEFVNTASWLLQNRRSENESEREELKYLRSRTLTHFPLKEFTPERIASIVAIGSSACDSDVQGSHWTAFFQAANCSETTLKMSILHSAVTISR